MSMATKIGRMITQLDELLFIMPHDPLTTLHGRVRSFYNLKLISNITLTTKLGIMVPYFRQLLPVKLL